MAFTLINAQQACLPSTLIKQSKQSVLHNFIGSYSCIGISRESLPLKMIPFPFLTFLIRAFCCKTFIIRFVLAQLYAQFLMKNKS